GRSVAPHSVLQTMLFSGEIPKYHVSAAQPVSTDLRVNELAEADRERELYVAMTRAKKTLTFLWDPKDGHPLMGLHEALAKIFTSCKTRKHPTVGTVEIVEYRS